MGWYDILEQDANVTKVADQPKPLTQRQINELSGAERKSYLQGKDAQKPKSWHDELEQSASPPIQAASADPNATPDAPSMLGRVAQFVTGKQDQRYKDAPVYSGHQVSDTLEGAAGIYGGANDEAMADIIGKQLGPRHIRTFKDANGYPMLEYQGNDGQRRQEYVNKPGLDMMDVSRTVFGALPYVATGGAAGAAAKGTGLFINTMAQGVTAGATNLAAQGARYAAGSDQGLDLGEASLTAAGGSAGPLASAGAGAIWRRIVTIPGLLDKTTGKLTPRGAAAAQRVGLDPEALPPEVANPFVEALAKTGDEAQAAVSATTKAYGIPVTKGQVTKDPYLLTQEEAMRRRLMGEQAQGVMREFDTSQQQAIRDAALGDGGAGTKPSIAGTLAPDRAPGRMPSDANPATLGQSVRDGLTAARQGAQAAENKAWESVPKMAPTKEALDVLPDHISEAIGGRVIDESTPAAARMGKVLDSFIKGETPASVAGVFKTQPIQDVDRMRRALLTMRGGAATNEDRAAARAVYDGFNSWIDAAAEKNLLAGDVNMAAQLKIARGFTKEMHEVFSPTMNGRATPAANRIAQALDGADTPEGVVQALLGSQGSKTINQGGVGALTNIKQALTKYAEPEVATQTWNDIRLAYWVRLVQGKNGEMLGPTAITNNVKNTFANQRTVLNTLYTPDEQAQMRIFMRAVEAAAYKPPNASGSGYSATQLMGGPLGKLFEAFGLNTKLAKTALEYTGVGNAYGSASARIAVSPSVMAADPNLSGPIAGATNALARREDRPSAR